MTVWYDHKIDELVLVRPYDGKKKAILLEHIWVCIDIKTLERNMVYIGRFE